METMKQGGFRDRPVGEVVADDYRRAGVFKRFGIDFCCSGGRTVQEACDRKGVEYDELEQALLASAGSKAGTSHPDARDWSLDFLADYIVNVHHGYVRRTLPVLTQFTGKVARVHGPGTPALVRIATLVEELSADLEQHMRQEEEVLFPRIRALVAGEEGEAVQSAGAPGSDAKSPGSAAESLGSAAKSPGSAAESLGAAAGSPDAAAESPDAAGGSPDSAAESIRLMETDHDHAGELMRQIRELSGDFVPPQGACNTYRASFVMLEECEEYLHRHVHLENNLLFPGALALEPGSAIRA